METQINHTVYLLLSDETTRNKLVAFAKSRMSTSTSQEANAEDVVQSVMLRTWQYGLLHPDQMIDINYLYEGIRHYLIDEYRKTEKYHTDSASPDQCDSYLSPHVVEDEVDQKLCSEELYAIISTLNPTYQAVTMLSLAGAKISEISTYFQINPAHSRVLLYRARQSLKKVLNKDGRFNNQE
jgi:RNA polymerase sigma factor (sigma-70 family)